MPAPSARTLTLRLLTELIISLEEIPLWKRRELCSAIKNFAKVCGRTPSSWSRRSARVKPCAMPSAPATCRHSASRS